MGKIRCALVGLLLTAGCGVSQELYNARTTELDKCQADLGKAQNELGQSHARNDALREQLDQRDEQIARLHADAQKLAGNLSATEHEMEALRKAHAQGEQRAELYRGLLTRLRDAIAAGTLAVEVRKGNMVVRLADQLLFDPGQSLLKPEGQKALHEVAQALKEIPDRSFLVAGHTDNQPVKSAGLYSNWELSTAHAVAVVRFLQGEGVDPRHLAAAGYSEFDSVADDATPQGRAQNRRIEIVILPRVDELPSIDVTPPAATPTAPPAVTTAPAAPATGTPPAPAPPTP